MRGTGGLAGAIVLAGLCETRDAAANGRFPAADELLFSPNDPSVVVLRATFGILLSHDRGATWQWLCEDAVGISPSQSIDPTLGVTANGTLLSAIPHRLGLSSNAGCDWTFAGCPFDAQTIVDVVVRPDTPHVVLAATSTPLASSDAGSSCSPMTGEAGTDDGGARYANGIFRSVDDGATWTSLGIPLDATVSLTTVDVAATDPNRIYVSAYRTVGDINVALLFVSMDQGASWTEHSLPPLMPTSEAQAYIAGVDPTDADRVYIRTGGLGASRLVVTIDAGASFQIPLTLSGQMLGFALSPDGSSIYAGSVPDGLWVAPRTSMVFARRSTIHVQCLATRGADLWACSNELSGFIAGVSSDDGATFAPKLHLADLNGPVACAADATAAQCSGSPYAMLCQTFHCGGDRTDAAADEDAIATVDAGAAQAPGTAAKSSCAAVGGGATSGVVSWTALASAVVARWRRQRRRSRATGRTTSRRRAAPTPRCL